MARRKKVPKRFLNDASVSGTKRLKYNWPEIKRYYTRGESKKTLREISEMAGAPSFRTLKKKWRLEKWEDDKNAYWSNVTKAAHDELTTSDVEMLSGHMRVINQMLEIGQKRMEQLAGNEYQIANMGPETARKYVETAVKLARLTAGFENADQRAATMLEQHLVYLLDVLQKEFEDDLPTFHRIAKVMSESFQASQAAAMAVDDAEQSERFVN